MTTRISTSKLPTLLTKSTNDLITMDIFNKIYNEDCIAGMKRIADNIVDLTVTSPPYDKLRTYDGHVNAFQFEPIAAELYRITKRGGVVVWICNDMTINGSETGTCFKQALHFKDVGFNLHDTMIYQKSGVSYPEINRYYPNFEYMFVLSKGKPKTTNLIADRLNKHAGERITGGERKPNGVIKKKKSTVNRAVTSQYGVRYNVWQYSVGFMHSTTDKCAYKHPAIFPERLVEDHIKSWSNEGDLVLDPLIGSGTTAVAAINTNRKYIGFEINSDYFYIAQQRINNTLNKKTQLLIGL